MTVDNSSQYSNNVNSSIFFSSAAVMSHNCRSLNASSSNSLASSISRTFFLGDIPVPLKEVDVLHLQETGKIANPESLFSPSLSLDIYSIDDANVYISSATYYNSNHVSLINSEIIHRGRASSHIFKRKHEGTIFATINVYGPPASTVEGTQDMSNLLNRISIKMQTIKDIYPMSCIYLASDFNCNTLNESLDKTKILRKFLSDQNLFELSAHLPPTWRGKRGEKNCFFQ